MLGAILKPILPAGLFRAACRFKEAIDVRRLESQRTRTANAVSRLGAKCLQKLLIVPPDPFTLIGSLGDDAMLTVTIEAARVRNKNVCIDILTCGDRAAKVARERGLNPIDIWWEHNFPAAVGNVFQFREIDTAVVLGADVMDGRFHPIHSAKLLTVVDIAASAGLSAAVLGFSFCANPAPELARMFNSVDERLRLNIRDEVSLARFKKFSSARVQLVSDIAFLLKPGSVDSEIKSWINRKRAQGRTLVGLNLHPMLFMGMKHEARSVQELIARACTALTTISAERPIAWLLLPHDRRGALADDICLNPIAERLHPILGDDIRQFRNECSARDVKALVGQLDGIVAARMHLTIGALGMSVPTFCITYQDKFEGLFRHFSLPESLMIEPERIVFGFEFENSLRKFLDKLGGLRSTISCRLPAVISRAQDNFSVFD